MKKQDQSQRYHVLARGAILADHHLLVAHCKGMDNTFLPGGHVEFHESIRSSLQREIHEELGQVCEIGAYIGAVEAAYEDKGVYHQEINHIFVTRLDHPDPGRNPTSQEDHLEFHWIPLHEMEKHNLLPVPVRSMIENYVKGVAGPFFGSTFEDS